MKFLKPLKIFFLFISVLATAQNLKVMSYNIRYNNPDDKENAWDERKADLAHQIQFYSPDVLGMQEVLFSQIRYLNNHLPGYTYVGVGREDGKTKGEFAPIYYNTKKLELKHSGTFWLSDTPDKISIGWDAALERICTYAVFRVKESDKMFMVFNAHFDHKGEKARVNSAQLILDKIDEYNLHKIPVIFMGDLNSYPASDHIQLLQGYLTDTYEATKTPHYGLTGTFNAFDVNAKPENRIDYIFTKGFDVLKQAHLSEKRNNGLWYSDHLPVFTVLNF